MQYQQLEPVPLNSIVDGNFVVFGRGRDIDDLPANVAFRDLARRRAQEYKSCSGRDGNVRKRKIAQEIKRAAGNRIFGRHENQFYELDEKTATKKIMQTIRDTRMVQSHNPGAEDANVDPGVVPNNENNRGLDHQQNAGAGGADGNDSFDADSLDADALDFLQNFQDDFRQMEDDLLEILCGIQQFRLSVMSDERRLRRQKPMHQE